MDFVYFFYFILINIAVDILMINGVRDMVAYFSKLVMMYMIFWGIVYCSVGLWHYIERGYGYITHHL